ncbi:hypothetical protein PFISCL1PPCAC_16081, partial [Pristionchus fissidentatus]
LNYCSKNEIRCEITKENEERRIIYYEEKLPKRIKKYLVEKKSSIRQSMVPCRIFRIFDQILGIFVIEEITFINVRVDSFFIAHLKNLFERRRNVKTVWCNGQMAEINKESFVTKEKSVVVNEAQSSNVDFDENL